MGERDLAVGKRRAARGSRALAGAVALAAAPFFVPSPAQAVLNTETSFNQNGQDEAPYEPLQEDALVIQEDGEDLLKIDFNQTGSCRAQFRATLMKWWANSNIRNRVNRTDGSAKFNNGDGIRPWPNQTFNVSGFLNFTKRVVGISTASVDGDVLFNNASESRPPARVVEYKGSGDRMNKMPFRFVDPEGKVVDINIPCGRLQHVPFMKPIANERS